MKLDFSTLIVGLILGIPAFALGVAGLIRSFRVDKSTAKQAVDTARGSEVQQIIDGLNALVDNLQADNLITRESAQSLSARLIECGARLSECVKDRDDLRRQLDDLK